VRERERETSDETHTDKESLASKGDPYTLSPKLGSLRRRSSCLQNNRGDTSTLNLDRNTYTLTHNPYTLTLE